MNMHLCKDRIQDSANSFNEEHDNPEVQEGSSYKFLEGTRKEQRKYENEDEDSAELNID